MKILVLHNTYQQPGGEDAVVRNEVAMLRAHGHHVDVHLVSNNAISGPASRLLAAGSTVFSLSGYMAVRRLINRLRPDVVHVHNTFPLLSPSVFYACRRHGVPSVLTLHNFRIVCPTALLMHNGTVTERSLLEGPWWAVRRRVYRGSLPGTAAVAAMITVHRRLGTWSRVVTRCIALTEFSRSLFEKAGIPRERLRVKPNFVDMPAQAERPRAGFLFAGRLSPEKGVKVLAGAVAGLDRVAVRVAGTGPLSSALEGMPGFQLLGAVPSAQLHEEMAASAALVVPSTWYEGFPMVIVEAYACGLPVIGSRLGAMAEVVEDGVTGLLFEPGSSEDLALKLQWAASHPAEMARMGRAARARYEKLYTAEANHAQLLGIYNDAIGAAEACA